MRNIQFVFALIILLWTPFDVHAFVPDADDNYCYPWQGEETWCNLWGGDEIQEFERGPTGADIDDVAHIYVTVGEDTYYVYVRIFDVYDDSILSYPPKEDCEVGTPARYWDHWECDTNTDYYFQNHDTCIGNDNKCLMTCYQTYITVQSDDGSHSRDFVEALELWLNEENHYLDPCDNPDLDPEEGSSVFYAIRAYPQTCSCD